MQKHYVQHVHSEELLLHSLLSDTAQCSGTQLGAVIIPLMYFQRGNDDVEYVCT